MEINIPPPPDGSDVITKPSKSKIPPPPDGSGVVSMDKPLPSMTVAEQPKAPKPPTDKEVDEASNIWGTMLHVSKFPERVAESAVEGVKAGVKKIGEGISQGAATVADNFETVANAYDSSAKGAYTKEQKDKDIAKIIGSVENRYSPILKVVGGGAGVAFQVIPAAAVFNAGVLAIKETADGTLSKEDAEVVHSGLDLPFTLATKALGAIGYTPKEGSDEQELVSLFDLVIAGKAIHSVTSAGGKVKSKINSIKDLKEISKEVAEGKLSEEQLAQYKADIEEIKNTSIEDIKKAALERNTPESLEIAKRIEELQQPTLETTESGIPRVVPPTAEKLAEVEKLKEESLTKAVMTEEGIPRVIKPTQEEINLAFKEKSQEQSKSVFNAIEKGEADVVKLKSSLDFAKERGKITPEEHALAIQKIDTYQKYFDSTKDIHITPEAKRNVFDLTWTNENLKAQIDAIESQIKAEPSNPLLNSKKNALESIYNENQKEIDANLTSGIADQMGSVSAKTQEKVLKNKVTSDNELTEAEKDWAKNPSNMKAVKAVIGEGKTHEAYKAEAKKQFWKQQPENIAKVDKMFKEGVEPSEKVWEAEMERQWKESQNKGSTIPEIKSNPPTEEHKVLHEYIDAKLPGKNFNNLADVQYFQYYP